MCDDHRRRRGGGGVTSPSRAYALPTQQILRPTANGTYTEWGETFGSGTTHWDRLDDVTPDDAGSYVMDNTWNGTERDTFQLQDTSITSIGSVEVVARATRITTNDNNNIRLFLRSGSTDSQSPVETLSQNYWAEVSYSWNTDPATGQPWTQAGVNALQAGVRDAMGPSGGGGVGVTQVYVLVTEGAEILRPTANGTYTEWGELWGAGTTHWDHVEEVTADDSASYIMDNTWDGTERDTFQLSDTSYASIASVEIVARASRITTNDNNNVRLFIRGGGSDSESPVQTLSQSWTDVSDLWTTDPATGLPWTQAGVNAMQAGVRNAMGSSGGGGVGVTQVYAIVHPDPPNTEKALVYNQTAGNWYGINGELKGGTGEVINQCWGAVLDGLDSARYVSVNGRLTKEWTQIGLYRGTFGDLTFGSCSGCWGPCVINDSPTPHVYTEAYRAPACQGDYFPFDWGPMTDPNMVFWNYYTFTWTDSCGRVEVNYDLDLTTSSGWPQKLIGGNTYGTLSAFDTALLELHDTSESTYGENCFGSVWYLACAAGTGGQGGLHLVDGAGSFLLWTPQVDPGQAHYMPDPYCSNGTGNPDTFWPLADYYSFRAFGPIC